MNVSCSLFSAVAVCTLNWSMINLLRKQRRIVWLTRCFWSAIDKRRHGNCRMKAHSEKCSAWYLKIIWKLQFQFADARLNWLTWLHNSSAFIRYSLFNILHSKKQHIFCSLPFYKHYYFLSLSTWFIFKIPGEESCVKFYFRPFCFAKRTCLLSILFPFVISFFPFTW